MASPRSAVEWLFVLPERLDSRVRRAFSAAIALLVAIVSMASVSASTDRRALIVGPNESASAFAGFLRDVWAYPEEAIDLRGEQDSDAGATSASGIAAALERIRAQTSPGDAVVVALAGSAARVAGGDVARRIAALAGRRVVIVLATSGPEHAVAIEPPGGLAALVHAPRGAEETWQSFAAATRPDADGAGPSLAAWRRELVSSGLAVTIPERLGELPIQRMLARPERLEDIAAEIAESPSDFEVDVELLDPLPTPDENAPPRRHRLRVSAELPGHVTLIAVRESGAIALVQPSATAWQARGRVAPGEPYVTEVPVDAFALTEAGAWVGVIALVCERPFLDVAPLETDRSKRRRQMIYRKTDRLDEAQLRRVRYAHYARLADRVAAPGGEDDDDARVGIGLLRLGR